MTNGNSAELKPSQKWTDRKKAVTEWENKIACHGGRNVTTREIACFEDGFEAAREILSVCADGGKDSSDHKFKNFHRLLCERFGYMHDEVDWKRDQLSLIEWIAEQVDGGKGEAALQRLTEEQERLGLYDDAPQAECAPRAAQPVAYMFEWPDGVSLTLYNDAEQRYGEKPLRVIPLYAAPQAECAPREAQPVARVNDEGFIVETGDLPLAPGIQLFTAPTPERADAAPNPSDKKEPVARYPHAAIGAALISSGIYDRMNDITGGDREARILIQELIAKVDPVLDRWHATVVAAAPTPERADAEKDAARYRYARQLQRKPEEYDAYIDRQILAANKEPQP